VLNELRIGDTRRSVTRRATSLPTTASDALGIPGIPTSAQFPNTLPTFLVSGYQQLGSPPNTASDFHTDVTEVADTLTWVKSRHTIKAGWDWRWERLDVVQPPSPTGSFAFNAIGSDLPDVSGTGTPLASLLLGQVQAFSIDLQQSQIRERAHFQEYFVQDDWRVSRRLTVTPGLRYTLNFPSTEINGQTAVFDLSSRALTYPGNEPVRPLKKDNVGPRIGVAYDVTGKGQTVLRAGYGMYFARTPNQTIGAMKSANIAPRSGVACSIQPDSPLRRLLPGTRAAATGPAASPAAEPGARPAGTG